MDVALLIEQYNSNKLKQILQTRVILFKKAPNNEDICGKSLVKMIPVNQEVKYPEVLREYFPVRQMKFSFTDDLDSDKTPWRTHLGIHRMTCATGTLINASDKPASTTSRKSTGNLSASKDFSQEGDESEGYSNASEDMNAHRFSNCGGRSEQIMPSTSIFRYPETWPKSSLPSLSSDHYPFPQRKCPKKSEAARRLGMY
ncbi:hypothetical protein GJAV_G00076800 [Gymnothorax javanicus]|nr:hypothetical protein GJAV_G00076800 [Gymnothorax javanicus]